MKVEISVGAVEAPFMNGNPKYMVHGQRINQVYNILLVICVPYTCVLVCKFVCDLWSLIKFR